MATQAEKRSETTKGEETHARIVQHAMTLASTKGLEALTIGELARDIGLSKSGLFAHFNSKEQLQLDILDAAAEHFRLSVFFPAMKQPRGLPRLSAIFDNWLGWVQSKELPGGCIFLAGAAEWDDREGPVREKLAGWFRALNFGLARAVQLCVKEKHLKADTNAEQFASECHGIVMKYHLEARLLKTPGAEKNARAAFQRLLDSAQDTQTRRRKTRACSQ